MAPDYRRLQLVCERQAVVTSNREARKALEDMAEEYRKMADFLERKYKNNNVTKVASGPPLARSRREGLVLRELDC
jgi:hypothetical protein